MASSDNPLIPHVHATFEVKRSKKTGLLPTNWLLAVLIVLDSIHDAEGTLNEDDLYSYDYSLHNSRASAIPRLLRKYGFPTTIPLSREGVTTRGAPALRMFRAMRGGADLEGLDSSSRKAIVLEAIDEVRVEFLKVVGRKQVALPSNVFDRTASFVRALLESVENRSNGRVEQALVGSKLQLRYPEMDIPINPGYAGDKQTGRESDFEVNNLRVLVSVSPRDNHFQSAEALADLEREVVLVVAEKSFNSARKRIASEGYLDTVNVASVADYLAMNMNEIAQQNAVSARQMCLQLAAEYNRRIEADFDPSLAVEIPPS